MRKGEISEHLIDRVKLLVVVCFFLSGLTGLIYEILWTRMIVKVIGCAPFAVSIVLTVFMGGLGVGSYLASRTVDRVKEPLRLVRIYGLLELAIGGYGLVLPALLIVFMPLYAAVYNQLFSYSLLYNILTFAGCCLLLVVPVICMGATLPVLCRFYVVRLSHLGTHAGRLYGLNTIGAAFGSLLCGFWLINLLGMWGTLALAVLLNAAIGLSCVIVSYRVRLRPVSLKDSAAESKDSKGPPFNEQPETNRYSGTSIAALIIFAVSGFCAMSYEVIWTRLLGLIVGPTTYSFTIVLVTFIAGLALGSMLFGWLADRIRRPVMLLIFTQFAAALLALGLSQVLGNSQFFFAKLIYHFQNRFALLSVLKALILFAFMLLPTLCLGATFPLVSKLLTESLSKVGRSIGFAYSINTIGAVLGSFCAGFVLIPLLGKENGLSLVVALQIFTSLTVGSYLVLANRQYSLRWAALTVVAVTGLFLCSYLPRWNRLLLAMGMYHRFEDIDSELEKSNWLEALLQGPKILAKQNRGELVYYGDGIGGFVTVLKSFDAFGTPHYHLIISGKADASSRGDMPTQVLSAHFPMMIHSNPKTVMVLGLASGVTAGEVLHYPVERVDVLEISPEVVEASDFFVPWNNNVLSNPRTQMIVQDARAHLQLTKRKYDVIISEPSNPWMAGIANLFTKEFFALARAKLNNDGIFCQWIHSYQMDWQAFSLVIRTFVSVFPNNILVQTKPGDYLMIGFNGNNKSMSGNIRRNLPYAQHSSNVTLQRAELLYKLIVTEDLAGLCGRGPTHTDNRPRLEFAAPKQMYVDDPAIGKNIRLRKWLSRGTTTIIHELITDIDAQIDFATLALSVYEPFANMVDLSRATPEQKERFFKIMETYASNNKVDYSIFTDPQLANRCRLAQIKFLESSIDELPNKALSYDTLAYLCLSTKLLDKAVFYYRKTLELVPEKAEVHNDLAVALHKVGELNEAIAHYKEALRLKPDYPAARKNLDIAIAARRR
jgi:spermidine synthase